MRQDSATQHGLGQFSRRTFAVAGAAGAAALFSRTALAAPVEVATSKVNVATSSGTVSGMLLRSNGTAQPGLVVWGGTAGEAAARRLAEQGFAVLLVGNSRHAASDARAINREARALVAWLSTQDGVAAAPASSRVTALGHGYVLRSVSAARPALSLASRAERRQAASFGMLVAMPEMTVARSPERMDLINASARIAYSTLARAA